MATYTVHHSPHHSIVGSTTTITIRSSAGTIVPTVAHLRSLFALLGLNEDTSTKQVFVDTTVITDD